MINLFEKFKGFIIDLDGVIYLDKKINDYEKTLDRCHSTVGIAILNTSITIVFGFSILVLSKFIPTIYFGIFTGIAMLLVLWQMHRQSDTATEASACTSN